jgi:nucleoside-diphosphate-sugar epimerase
MKVCILGNKGFVGSAIERFLSEKGVAVEGINRDNYEQLKGTECDIFINAAGSSSKRLAFERSEEDFRKNVAETLSSLLDFRFAKYIYISTIDVYNNVSDPVANSEVAEIDPSRLSNYGLHKWLGEQLVKKYAKKWLILRLGGMVGKGLKKNAIFDLLNRKSLFVHPESRYQYIGTDEVARILWALKDKEGEVFNVCGDGTVSLEEIADALGVRLPRENYSLKKEVYDINIEKLKLAAKVPKTKELVVQFCRTYMKATT